MSRITPESEIAAEGESPQETAAPTIALWGAAGSGKSGIVGALRGEADKSVGERWAVDIRRADRSVTASDGPSTSGGPTAA
jgi:ABC-type transport system involved in cytochrome bd biosynthesis fused ATPase/permease subunit